MSEEQERRDTNVDVENEAANSHSSGEKDGVDTESDEYLKLVKYVSTYREPGRKQDTENGEVKEQRLWYAPWRKRQYRVRSSDQGTYPDEWLITPINNGLSSEEVETRRKRTGFNELSAEKEHLFAKFMSYFRGPILYGQYKLILLWGI